MHIALWSPAWPIVNQHNGIVTYVHWTKRELMRQGHRVSVFTSGLATDWEEADVYSVDRGWLGSAARRFAGRLFSADEDVFNWGELTAQAMLRVHKEHPIDIVEIEESFGWCEAVARITGLPLVAKLHGPAFLSLVEDELNTSFGRERVEREGLALAQMRAIASPCAITLRQTVERYDLRPAVAQHVVNPMSAEAGTPLWSQAGADPNRVLFVGRFDSRKGGDLVIRAFAQLLRTRPTLHLVFVGPDRGLLQPDGSRVSIVDFISATVPVEWRDRISVRGPLPQQEIAALRLSAAVTLLASRWENQGYTALEAMLQGCPVVSSDAGGCPELIEHGHNGLLARTGDAQDLADQIAKMLGDPAAAAEMGSRARQFVSEVHAPDKVAAQSVLMYERVIEDHRSGLRTAATRRNA